MIAEEDRIKSHSHILYQALVLSNKRKWAPPEANLQHSKKIYEIGEACYPLASAHFSLW